MNSHLLITVESERASITFDLWIFKSLRRQCQDFATALLDHTRSSYELEVLLNYDPQGPAYQVSKKNASYLIFASNFDQSVSEPFDQNRILFVTKKGRSLFYEEK